MLSHPDQLKELLGIPFNREQMRAIGAPLEPAVIVAGAGSGKTTVMAARVVWLVGSGAVRPDQVLGLTFTNKAAAELAERVRTALARAGLREDAAVVGEPEISTYHAFAGRLLKEHGLRIGIEPDVRLLADATRFQLAARVLRSARGPFPHLKDRFSALVSELTALDAELAEHLVEPAVLRAFDAELLAELAGVKLTNQELRDVPEAAQGRQELLTLVEEYRRRKRAAGLLDFGDQIAASARLAQQRPEVGRLLREQYQVVLLDEYQDTSVAQRLLLAGLFGATPAYPGGHPVTAVGDPCQAIYGWRGASVANLDDFPAHFPKADGGPGARYALSENRRSGGRLLAFANELAAPLRARHQGVEALRPAPGAERDGLIRVALLPTHAEEIDWLADSIAHLVRTGTAPGSIAVLCRGGAAFPDIHAALVAREVPVEVVGLGGLLQLPEVADLVAVCEVLQDPTANAALVRLLIGPRWRIGPRDLALLGRRAAGLVRTARAGGADALSAAVAETDPTEVVSLCDALETFVNAGEQPDELPFSAEARTRFAYLAREIRDLRRALADPLMDVLHRVLAATGLDVELSASPLALAARRRETLQAFLDVAAGFADLDGDPGLSAFLAFLRAAEEYDRGLDSSLPGGEDTVKVLTAHKSKGLEWDVVALPGLVKGAFPSSRGRERWTSRRAVLPYPLRGDAATLPEVADWTAKGMTAFKAALKDQTGTEELRLGYVAVTRPRSLLLAGGHWWGPTQSTRRGPSEYLEALRAHAEQPGAGEVEQWAEPPVEDAENPALRPAGETPWPLPLDSGAHLARRRVAQVIGARLAGAPAPAPEPLAPEEQRQVDSWDRDLNALLGELERARRTERAVPLPPALSATQLMRLAADPDGLAHELARPMPRPPAGPARRGTRFHAWIQARYAPLPLLEPDALLGPEDAADDGIEDERDLERLKEAFLRGPYAHRRPYRVEAPVQVVLAGRVVRGRIDAVYRERDDDTGSRGGYRYEVVDWKTGHQEDADPLQLAIYRLAWAEQRDLPLEQVTAAFCYVRSGRIERPTGLPDRNALETLLVGKSD
ncbi:DNA helicase-2/ATP-dependent DNA helicase PcrA [Kitasatospora sp. GAS204A]|uniref:ATP-dependent DNA helicase n=1 Tax=unclassified Kitasatospora TaxID=2633591 RepID=UPI002476A140|nr:ATP-dependent DNA helicase [Kitasatospora sp. GAS204B]MDH6116492.1 DNA helicase-2/ATP-dependent DNA helicase PcrA [Kitasatospora sp. GAS204B]